MESLCANKAEQRKVKSASDIKEILIIKVSYMIASLCKLNTLRKYHFVATKLSLEPRFVIDKLQNTPNWVTVLPFKIQYFAESLRTPYVYPKKNHRYYF